MNEENKEPQVPNFEGEAMKMPENNDAPAFTEEKSSVITAPLLFTLAIILILILGGMYYWYTTVTAEPTPIETAPEVQRPTAEENNEPESTTAEAQVDTMQAVSTSDEISAIESDIEGTMLDEIDAEINAIEAELDASIE